MTRTPPLCRLMTQNIANELGNALTKAGVTKLSDLNFCKLGENPMQPLPPQLELPEGDRFTLPTISAVRELSPPGGQLPAHMVLMMICGKELWVPLDREIAQQMANVLAPFRD